MNAYTYSLPLLLLSIIAPAGASAQLHESVSVDGTYLRDVLHPDRINQLPHRPRLSLGETPLDYASAGVKADFIPLSPVADATAFGASLEGTPTLGYLDLEGGSYLNSSVSLGIGAIRRSEERLDLRLQHNSTTFWRPFGDLADARVSYAESLGVAYARKFSDMGLFSASAQYHVGYFNYYGLDPDIAGYTLDGTPMHLPTQTLNDAALRLGWTSDPEGGWPVDWNAALSARYFGYRTATRETQLSLSGGAAMPFGQKGRLGIDASLDMLFYSEARDSRSPDAYSTLSLRPYYKWQKQNLSLRIGADIDLAFNADGYTPDTHYAALHASPDVRFDVAARNVGFYVHLLGGTELHTLAAMSQIDPCRNPHLESTRPVHTPLDANIGLNLTPFRGFTAELNLQYKSSTGVPMEGWYMAWLNYGDAAMPGLTVPDGIAPEYGMAMQRYSLSGFGASLRLAYRPSSVLALEAKGSYTPQHDKTGIFNGLDRPRWILDAGVELSPMRQLTFGVNYSYRGVRRIFTGYTDPEATDLVPGGAPPDPTVSSRQELASLRLPDITNLSASVRWDATRNFSLRFEASNLLGQRALLLPMTPTEGITFAGGFQWLF